MGSMGVLLVAWWLLRASGSCSLMVPRTSYRCGGVVVHIGASPYEETYRGVIAFDFLERWDKTWYMDGRAVFKKGE